MGIKLDKVINIAADKEILIERVVGRRICKVCGKGYHIEFNPPKVEGVCDIDGGELFQREDDTRETVSTRIEVYEEQTQPLIDYYNEKVILININGAEPIAQVFENIVRALENA